MGNTTLPPPIRPVDKSRSAEPKVITLSMEDLKKGVGFQSVERLLPHLKTCFQQKVVTLKTTFQILI